MAIGSAISRMKGLSKRRSHAAPYVQAPTDPVFAAIGSVIGALQQSPQFNQFTPALWGSGVDTDRDTVCDLAVAVSDAATVTFSVLAHRDRPVAANNVCRIDHGTTLSIRVPSSLDFYFDQNDEWLTCTLVSQRGHGTLMDDFSGDRPHATEDYRETKTTLSGCLPGPASDSTGTDFGVQGSTIGKVALGVFFYSWLVLSPSSDWTGLPDGTAIHCTFAELVERAASAMRLVDLAGSWISEGTSSTSNGDVTLNINGATTGRVLVVLAEYDASTLAGHIAPTNPSTVTLPCVTKVHGSLNRHEGTNLFVGSALYAGVTDTHSSGTNVRILMFPPGTRRRRSSRSPSTCH